MNLVAVASDRQFAHHVVNWDECISTLGGMLKTGPHPHTLDRPDPYFNEVLAEFTQGDPVFLKRLIDLFAEAPPREPRARQLYRVVWRDDDYGEMRLLGMTTIASEPESLGFNDWIPLDAASWTALERVKARRQRR
jgi:hypothetical protein